MKIVQKGLYCVVLFLTMSHSVIGQEVIDITFPPASGQTIVLPGLKKFKKGEFFQIHISGINLNNYKVSINSKDTVLSSPLNLPDFGNFNLDLLGKLVAGINLGGVISTKIDEEILMAFGKITNPGFETNLGTQDEANLKKYFKSNEDVIKAFEAERELNEGIVNRMNAEKTTLNDFKTNLEQLKTSIDEWKLKINLFQLESKKNNASALTAFGYDNALRDLVDLRQKLKDIQSNSTTAGKNYLDFSIKNEAQIAKVKDLKDGDEKIKQSYAEVSSALGHARNIISADSVYKTLLSLIHIENNGDRDFYSLPMQLKKGQAEVDIVISPIDKTYNLQEYRSSFIFPIDTTNYWGVGPAFYLSSLYDQAFSSIRSVQANGSIRDSIILEDNKKAEMGTAALLRLGTKTEGKVGLHASFGLGLSLTQKIRPRFLFGGGASFGKTHMLALDLGLITGYVDKLSKALNVNSTYTQVSNGTISRLGLSGFLSVGYVYRL